MGHTYNPRVTQDLGTGILSIKPAWALSLAQRDPVSKKQKQTNKQTNKKQKPKNTRKKTKNKKTKKLPKQTIKPD
jgi:Sec-independent protein translocase protein TatA